MSNFINGTQMLVDLVTDKHYIIIIECTSDIGTIFAFLGVISNIIIRTFIAMGLSDGVTVSFLALAIFDLTYLIASLSLGVAVVFYVIEMRTKIRFKIEPYGVCLFFGSCMIFINLTNVLATTFLAVARCMCVSRPLQFKNTFTRKRAIYFMITFAIFSIIIYLPILVNMGMVQRFDSRTNTSRPSLWISPKREFIKEIVWLVIDMVLPVATQLIILVCVVIMVNSLQEASRFRQSTASISLKPFTHQDRNKSLSRKVKMPKGYDSNNVIEKLTGKDLLVVQQVVLISVVYIVCNTPKILISIATSIEPEFTIGKTYSKLYMCANGLRKHFEILNAAVNLIIYYKYNTKFRAMMRRSFSCKVNIK
ncbi:unnamed protein product [Candidula unifasciata]|uniref:G-protein coupled receptors family 1 profile domain-containing protein n=1 Tax=Candidula unifasciata TaxID=100452 RepID=A0A8S3ZY42_9EUPU|nr:unnamed protein product [Candidula unifasciata]